MTAAVYSHVRLVSEVARTIAVITHARLGRCLAVSFWRPGEEAPAGRYLITERDVPLVLAACTAAAAGETRETGRIETTGPIIHLGASRGAVTLHRTIDGRPMGRMTFLGGEELSALERAAKALATTTDYAA